MILLEFGGRLPWMRRHRCPTLRVLPATPAPPGEFMPPGHATWVSVGGRTGWLHHHDPEHGWCVQFLSGVQEYVHGGQFEYVDPANIPQRGDVGG